MKVQGDCEGARGGRQVCTSLLVTIIVGAMVGTFSRQPRVYRGRLAPSPTGALHLGNVRTFMIAWLRCRSLGGRLILRIEDLDHPKVKRERIGELYDDLRWLGFDWDEGPDVGGPCAPYIQSERIPTYRAAFEKLRQEGRIYPCTCSRKDIEEAQSAPHEGDELFYPNLCRGRYRDGHHARTESGREPAWRFYAPWGESHFEDVFAGPQIEDLCHRSGDFVIARGPDHPAYQLAVVVDDAAMGVTEVVRGNDLLFSTHRQLAIYEALGLHPPAFLHVPLVVGPDGRRLAKRHGDTRISHYRHEGIPPERIIGWLAATCGWAERGESLSLRQVLERFDLKKLPPQAVVIPSKGMFF